MVRVEQYKLFHNSKDLEIIYKKSLEDLKKEPSHKDFASKCLKPAINNGHCLLLYSDDKVIGYEIAVVRSRIIEGGYTFILPEHRGKKYSRILREKMFDLLKSDVKEIRTFIRNSNINSMESVKKIAAELNLKIEEEYVRDNNHNIIGKIYKAKNEKRE